jgi:hypothetical protein
MKNTITYRSTIATILALLLLVLGGTFSTARGATSDDTESPVVGTAKITESEALGIAGKAYTGAGKFTDIELEMEADVLVYAIEYTEQDGNEVDVKIDAKTGRVVLVESDKDEAVDDDQNDTEGDDVQVTKMQSLINLLNQLIALLKLQNA